MKILVEKRTNWLYKQIINKYMGMEERFLWWVGELQPRIKRLTHHLISGGQSIPILFKSPDAMSRILNWWSILSIYIMEFLGIGEFYQTMADLIKFNTRPLSSSELNLVTSVFGDAISYELVRLDESSFLGPKQQNIIYVSFHTINSWGRMSNSILIHEMVHVWQYEQLGAKYMPMALAAQRSAMGYNYGGVEALEKYLDEGLKAFNLEQQADIIADYYRIKNDFKPHWGKGSRLDLSIYEVYVNEIRATA